MEDYDILASNEKYNVKEMLESRKTPSWSYGNKSTTVVFRYNRTDCKIIDPDKVMFDVVGQVDWGDAHPLFGYVWGVDENGETISEYNKYGLFLSNIETRPVDDNPYVCDVVLSYKSRELNNGGSASSGDNDNGERWEWDLNARQGIEKEADKGCGAQVPYGPNSDDYLFESALNRDISGNVQGVSLYKRSSQFRATVTKNISDFSKDARDNISKLSSKLNSDSFLDYDPRTILFLGASISYDYTNDLVTITYNFLQGFCESSMSVKCYDIKTGIEETVTLNDITPFEYIWKEFVEIEEKDATTGEATPIVKCNTVFRSNPYKEASFSILGLTG